MWIPASALKCTLILALVSVAGLTQRVPEKMRTYTTKYYIIHTDLDEDQAREADIRMTKMAEEYMRRMRDFGGGGIRKKLPFYLYADPEDYYATGAPRNSGGRFNGNALLAVAKDFGPKTWHLVQHEGFHQFAAAAINANLPPWVNEGLAEYFGEGIFTGDGFVTGVIPQWRLERIRKRFANNEFKSLRDFMYMPVSEWNNNLSIANYDQAWSMVQFLAHGDGGRYQKVFAAFMGQLGRGNSWQVAWKNSFGDMQGFEDRWREFWLALGDEPTSDLYVQANVAMLTSFLARAIGQGQTFVDFDAFAAAIREKQIKHHSDDWLPPILMTIALKQAEEFALKGARYEIAAPGPNGLPHIRCTLRSGTAIAGRFTIRSGRILSVLVSVE